ncbi:isochorismate synthase [Thermobifida halotolerans]|uniref:isochorismate synthase n=1 Tax=Thermobifida halotolerans TaxID=483545 RepID=UPI000B01926F|nr:isochorismate synthase [Thermobifida halotolerans]
MTSVPARGPAPAPLRGHRPGDFVLAAPGRTLLARDPVGEVVLRPGEPEGDLRERLAEGTAAGAPRPAVAVGALPFDPGAPARLVVPRTVVSMPRSADPPPPPGPPFEVRCRHEEPSAREYARGVARAVDRISRTGLRKVVLARALDLSLDRPVDPGWLLRRLAGQNPRGYAFAVEVPGADRRTTLVGASPELLVARRGRAVRCHPLAGSAARDADPDVDRRRARSLAGSEKDRREHAFVVAAIADALRPLCTALDVPARPSLTATATMWHLGTRITGELADPEVSSLALARAVHPTPAVCGTPTEAARQAVAELEPFDRGHYAGAVGWCDAEGDGEWAVALRCAEVSDREVRLFAGAGIVADSDPRAELAETAAKFRTVLAALGVEPHPTEPPTE